MQKQNRKLFFSKFSKISPERGHQEVLKTGVKLLVYFSNFCQKCQCHKNKEASNNQISASFLKLGQNPHMMSEKNGCHAGILSDQLILFDQDTWSDQLIWLVSWSVNQLILCDQLVWLDKLNVTPKVKVRRKKEKTWVHL